MSSFVAYAQVMLEVSIGKPLDYGLSKEQADCVEIGSLVEVPLKNRTEKGFVTAIRSSCDFPKIRPLKKVVSAKSLLPPDLFALARWISLYYCCPLRRTVAMMLPKTVREGKEVKVPLWVSRKKTIEELRQQALALRGKSPSQASVLDAMMNVTGGMLLSQLQEEAGVSRSPIDSLVQKGLLEIAPLPDSEAAGLQHDYFTTRPKKLNQEQQAALNAIYQSMETARSDKCDVHLLFGVTGSGKTEVYLQAIAKVLEQKKKVLMLVPEIALTPQTIERFRSRFDVPIAILHHRLTPAQRQKNWEAIHKGQISIVIGARSAIFCPLSPLGLIILDEEHESSYKSEESPHYHTIEVARMRAQLQGATLVLGSATPSLESYYRAQKGEYRLSVLQRRAHSAQLPVVKIVDMKPEYEKFKGFTLFSDVLIQAIKQRQAAGEQTLLFLNRRGYYTCLQCKDCGQSLHCPHCDLSMAYHLKEHALICHLCHHRFAPPPTSCRHCKSTSLRYQGWGTQHVEKTLQQMLPSLRTLRLDADTTRHKGSLEKILQAFRTGKADVLIGTQMIAKGHHFPAVTLVAILNPDQQLHLPDFRASEQLFSLIMQVSGRAGRGELKGEVFLQTAMPEHNLFKLALQQDYPSFYEEEIAVRQLFDYPPYLHLAKCLFIGPDEEATYAMAQRYSEVLLQRLPPEGQLSPVGPAGHAKIQDQYRFQFLIKVPSIPPLSKLLFALQQECPLPANTRLQIDMDPLHLF
jgi:primosomal protein N' (replication factor Y)